MTKRLKIFYAVLAIVAGVIFGPAIVERFWVSPSRSFFAGDTRCVCGHWSYFRIEADYLVKRNLGHNMTEEMYRIERASASTYRLFDSRSVEVGGLIVMPDAMKFDFGSLHFSQPRILNRWKIWWEQFRASGETAIRKPQVQYEDKMKNRE